MRARLLLSIVAAASLVGCSREPAAQIVEAAPAPAQPYKIHPMYRIIEAPYESRYELVLDAALRTSMYPDAVQQICSQWFPEYGRDVADAFVEWRAKNQLVLDELRNRSTEVWNRRAGPDIAYVKMVYPHIRKDVVDVFMRQSDKMSVENFKASCAEYPALMRKPEWQLERKLKKELVEIREGPPAAPAAAKS